MRSWIRSTNNAALEVFSRSISTFTDENAPWPRSVRICPATIYVLGVFIVKRLAWLIQPGVAFDRAGPGIERRRTAPARRSRAARGTVPWRVRRCFLVILLCCSTPHVLAHADIDERIAIVDAEIAHSPNDADLFLKRADLHRLHEEMAAALADYRQAEALDPASHRADFGRGQLYLASGDPVAALASLDRYLSVTADNADAWLTRARALVAAGRHREAVADYERAIALHARVVPEYYIERADAQIAADDGHVDAALAGLDQALEVLGPVFTLQDKAIGLEIVRRRYDHALARLDTLPDTLRSTPAFLLRRGELLELAGRYDAAQAMYREALDKLDALPGQRRATRAQRELEETLMSRLPDTDAGVSTHKLPEPDNR